jgi:four helix bundle protein
MVHAGRYREMADDQRRREADVSEEDLLDHERLDAYRVAVELDALVARLARQCGRGHGWLVEQTQEASGSAVLNLAEAVGREGADRARCLRIARGSGLEADGGVTLMLNRRLCTPADRRQARQLVLRLTAMLTKMIRSALR